MDEPTSALTAREVEQLFALIERLTARGVAVVYITHRLDEVYRIGQRVTVLRDGRQSRRHRCGGPRSTELVRLMANRDLGEHFPQTARRRAGLASCCASSTSAARRAARHQLALRAGEVVGIAGLLGAGRSELARVIAGADRVDTGRIVVDGAPSRFAGPPTRSRRHRPAAGRSQGAGPRAGADRRAQHRAAARPPARALRRPAASRAKRRSPSRSLDELRVKATPTQPVRLLSGGNQQKVVLGKWLAGDARIFIFDEPTRGIDVGAKVEIYHLMNRLTAPGAGIIMISSELPELLGMSDRILVMRRGRIQASSTPPTRRRNAC